MNLFSQTLKHLDQSSAFVPPPSQLSAWTFFLFFLPGKHSFYDSFAQCCEAVPLIMQLISQPMDMKETSKLPNQVQDHKPMVSQSVKISAAEVSSQNTVQIILLERGSAVPIFRTKYMKN